MSCPRFQPDSSWTQVRNITTHIVCLVAQAACHVSNSDTNISWHSNFGIPHRSNALFMSQNIQVLLCRRLRNFTSGDGTVCISPFNSIQGHCNGVENSTSRFGHQSHQALSNTLEEALDTILLCSLNIAVTASINPLKHGVLLNN